MALPDDYTGLQEQVLAACAARTPLVIRGGGSKAFYGRRVTGTPLAVDAYRGIVDYAPTELVVSARCGTPLAELVAVLAEQGQMLPFEPPHFAASATVGGMVAAGLSGPRRPWGGALRDAVLGAVVLTGRGEVLRFGGRVMKNVAGYDLARLMAGSLGSLGVILEVSLKVLPRPAKEITLMQEADAATALARLTAWQGRPWPLSASLHDGARLWLRLSGSHAGVNAARDALGGERVMDDAFWQPVREHGLPFFSADAPLWRLCVPPASPLPDLPGAWLTEWGGAQRWLKIAPGVGATRKLGAAHRFLEGPALAARIRAAAAAVGGHATLFRGHDGDGSPFQPLPAPLLALQRRVKASFDPAGILNPGVLYPDF